MPFRDGHIAEAGRQLDRFAEEANWGFIRPEFLKYMKLEHIAETPQLDFHYMKKHIQIPTWFDLSNALLQRGKESSFTERKSARYSKLRKSIKSSHIHDGTRILAKNKVYAYARLFVEIEEDIDEIIRLGAVQQNSGYMFLRALSNFDEPKDIFSLMSAVGFQVKTRQFQKNYHSYYRKQTLAVFDNLQKLGLIFKKRDHYRLVPQIKQAFDHADNIRSDVLNWKYRINWILPLKK